MLRVLGCPNSRQSPGLNWSQPSLPGAYVAPEMTAPLALTPRNFGPEGVKPSAFPQGFTASGSSLCPSRPCISLRPCRAAEAPLG